MKKTIKAWAMFGPNDVFHWWSVQPRKQDVVRKVEDNYMENWPHLRDKLGYHIRRITIAVDKP